MRTFLLASFFFFTSFSSSQTISWQQLSGPHGGNFYSIVTDNSGNIYVNTTETPGPFKSTDDGESWFSILNGLTPQNNGGFHPLNINSYGDLFIGGANDTYPVCRSTDGGSSWETLNNLNPGSSVICISFDQSENVYVGTGTGIYKSTDNGDNWAQYGMNGSQVEAVAFNSNGHVFAGTSTSVYRSTDDGANWTQLPTGGGARTVAIADNGYIFTGKLEGGGIARSTDNGDNWTYVYPQTVTVNFASTVLFDVNGDIYFPTWGNGVIKSTDDGENWTEMNNGIGYNYLRALAKNSSGSLLAVGAYALYKSTNAGSNWYSVGLPICSVREMTVNSNDDIFTAVWGINRSTDRGQTWQTINNGLLNHNVRDLTINEITGSIFTVCDDYNYNTGLIFKSTDKGDNWSKCDTGIPSGDHVLSVSVNSLGYVFVFGNGYNQIIYMSTDDGDTWTYIGYNLNFGPSFSNINSTDDIFVSGGNSGMWRLLANDTVWTQVATFPVNEFFIASNNYIYTKEARSTDNGQTWTTIGNGYYIISFAENSAGHIFFGTNQYGNYPGVYRSTDYGETLEYISDGLSAGIDISSLAVDSEDYLYAGTWGKSVFKTTTSTVVSIEDIKFKTTSFSLEQNYPNPFNPSTIVKYSIPQVSQVQIKIFDVLGNELETLVNEEKQVGTYELTWYAGSLPSGVYFYQLKAGSFVETKKMLLMK